MRGHIWLVPIRVVDAKPDIVRSTQTDKQNFIRRSGKVKDYLVSKAIDSEVKKPAKLKYMAKE